MCRGREGKMKTVHFNFYHPSKQNERCQYQIIQCQDHENCDFLKRGQCVTRYGFFGRSCVSGKFIRVNGPTKRSKEYFNWKEEIENKYNGIRYLDSPKKLGFTGDRIFLPYPYLEESVSGVFIDRKDFTSEYIIGLLKLRPRAISTNCIIEEYQNKIVPKIINHLREIFPDLLNKAAAEDEEVRCLLNNSSDVGRTAILQTTTPDVGFFNDIHGGSWSWDGEELMSMNAHVSFGLCDYSCVSLVPKERQTVKITCDEQVNENTEFLD